MADSGNNCGFLRKQVSLYTYCEDKDCLKYRVRNSRSEFRKGYTIHPEIRPIHLEGKTGHYLTLTRFCNDSVDTYSFQRHVDASPIWRRQATAANTETNQTITPMMNVWTKRKLFQGLCPAGFSTPRERWLVPAKSYPYYEHLSIGQSHHDSPDTV